MRAVGDFHDETKKPLGRKRGSKVQNENSLEYLAATLPREGSLGPGNCGDTIAHSHYG